jgi:hypothetical protein
MLHGFLFTFTKHEKNQIQLKSSAKIHPKFSEIEKSTIKDFVHIYVATVCKTLKEKNSGVKTLTSIGTH